MSKDEDDGISDKINVSWLRDTHLESAWEKGALLWVTGECPLLIR